MIAGKYSITVERVFCAAHALRFPDGTEEPMHGHNWTVRATISSRELDAIGVVTDFHIVADRLEAILLRFNNQNLNVTFPFTELNPTAELVARHIFDELDRSLDIAPAVVESVSVTEAPGCLATFSRE